MVRRGSGLRRGGRTATGTDGDSDRPSAARSRRGILAALAAVAMATGGTVATAASHPPAAAAASSAAPIVFILDASGSMVREVSPGATRMDVAKQAMIDTFSALPAGTEVGLLVFGTGTGNSEAEQAAGCRDVSTLAPPAPVDPDALADVIEGVEPSGFTPIGEALKQAAGMLPSDEAADIVLVSDGVDTCAPPSSCEVASQLHRDRPLLSISVVAFGVDDDEAARQQMTCIGGVGGGTAVSATDPAQLAARLRAASAGSTSSDLLSARGFRGVQFGMSLDEVRASVDGAAVGEPRTVDGVVVVFVDCGWGTVELHDNRVYAIVPKESATTVEGLGPGASQTVVEALYGPATRADADVPDTLVYAAEPGRAVGYRISFDSATRTVRRIVVCRCVAVDLSREAASAWEAGYDGVGPLAIGMALDTARTTLPALRRGDYAAFDGGSTWFLADVNGGDWLTADFDAEDRLVTLTIADPHSDWDVPADGGGYPGARGIRMGESMATVVNTFPGGTFYRNLSGGMFDYLTLNREGVLIAFRSRPGTVEGDEYGSGPILAGTLESIRIEDAARTR